MSPASECEAMPVRASINRALMRMLRIQRTRPMEVLLRYLPEPLAVVSAGNRRANRHWGIHEDLEPGVVLECNEAFLRLVARPRERVIGHHFREFTTPETLAAGETELGKLISGFTDHYQIEKEYFRPDGSIVPITLSVTMVCDETTREPWYFIANAHDERRRLRAEELQRVAEESALAKNAELSAERDYLRTVLAELQDARSHSLEERTEQAIANLDALAREWGEDAS